MVKVPCQEIVWDIIPAIQAALAAELVSRGISQIKVAKSLLVAPSAVSQYLSGKRGSRIVFDDKIRELIGQLAEDINSGTIPKDKLGEEFCVICRYFRGSDSCGGGGLGA
ncbi:MAG TPA: transcriptional regulator [Methanocorpusculum sp.]|nr:transcriptional regulator [Methanocorpusculum sp.]